MVEFVDGSLKAQLGHPDMRLPIAVALGYPDRLPDAVPPTALDELAGLEFHALDEARFPSVRLARQAALAGGRPSGRAERGQRGGGERLPGRGHPVQRDRAHRGAGAGRLPGQPAIRSQEILEADRWAREYVESQLR